MMKVLIVDDQQMMRAILRGILLKGGYSEIIEADSGDAAVELYSNERPDLVFMDLVMPASSGMNAISNIRAKDPNAKIIVVSAIGAQITIQKAKQLGVVGYLTKPLKEEEVLALTKKVLGDTNAQSTPGDSL